MEFDWLDSAFDLKVIQPKHIEESFEDPFSLRLLPEGSENHRTARYFCLGRSAGGVGIFSVFWTDGKNYRVVCARQMNPEEELFYERKNSEMA